MKRDVETYEAQAETEEAKAKEDAPIQSDLCSLANGPHPEAPGLLVAPLEVR